MNKQLYHLSKKEVEQQLETNFETGLSLDQVKTRREQNGENKLLEAKKRSIFLKFFDQFKDFMIVVLIAAALISILAAKEYANGLLIILIVVVNAILGVAQEEKAEKTLESIKALSSPHVTVLRENQESVIDVKDLVVGDVVLLVAGDYVPADVRIIESINLKIDESALTGEAVPVEKVSTSLEGDDIPLGDRINLGFMSTVVTYGRGKAVVADIGMQTEMGKIATLLNETESDTTPLQKNIGKLGKTLAIIALLITGFIFIIEIIQGLILYSHEGFINALLKVDWIGALLFAVSLAVAAIPEGLPAIITVVLSLGMQNLVKQRAIMRTLPAVETLGSTQIICSDKTGTLTQNVMTVQQVFLNQTTYAVQDIKSLDSSMKQLVHYGVLVNDTKVNMKDDQVVRIGDPTEIAFIDLALVLNENPLDVLKKYPRIHELPFDSERKLMTTVHDFDHERYAIIKGAPDVLLSRAKSYSSQDKILQDQEGLKAFENANNNMANQALRVLAVAFKKIDKSLPLESLNFETLEHDVTILGLVGMIDPPRPEVKDAIALCNQAGIKTIMITGDHKNTAMAIAKQIGILEIDDLAITGKELDQMSDKDFLLKLEHIRVYARVSPENKVRIVKAWRQSDQIVAMTGDGVNDAPSIKQADIGIAMGITGTEVAKGAADMILTDDNFATIVNAVGEGRTIFSNIKKAIHFLLSCNIGEIVAMFLGVVIGIFIFGAAAAGGGVTIHILAPAQILWVNLVTDSFMAIALGLEPKEPDVMLQKPRDAKKSIFSEGLGFKIAWQGMMIGILTFLAYTIGWFWDSQVLDSVKIMHAQTMAFMVLALSQLAHAFNARSAHHSIFSLKRSNAIFYALAISFSLQMLVIILPFTRAIFDVEIPQGSQWLVIILLSITPIVVVEIQKWIHRRLQTKKA